MLDVSLIQTLGIVIVTSTVAVLAARLARIPAIVAYLFAGLLLGPVLAILPGQHGVGEAEIEIVAEIGIVLLLFLVGLELSLDKIRDVGKVALSAGIGQVVFTAAGGVAIAWLMGFDLIESVFLSTALTFSSTVVVVKVLDQKGELDSLYGRIAVGIFLVQDLVVIVVLTVLAGLGASETFSAANVAVGILKAFAGMSLLTVLALVAAKYVLPGPFGWIARSPQALLVWSLSWCFLLVLLAAAFGLSLEIGAFLAGVSLAQLKCSHDLTRRVRPLMNFFIAVFFVTLGAQMRFDAAVEHWKAAVAMSLFVLLGNPFIFMLIIARYGYSERTSFFTSVTVAQISEFSFVFAAVGVSAGLIDRGILSLIAVVGLITIVASVYMILYSEGLYQRFRRWGLLRMFKAGERVEPEAVEPARRGHILIVGMNALGRRLSRELHQLGERVLAIDTDARKLANLPCETMIGNVDAFETLQEAGVSRARLVITALQIEEVNQLLAYRCRELSVPIAVHIFDRSMIAAAESLQPRYLINSKTAADLRVEKLLVELGVLSP